MTSDERVAPAAEGNEQGPEVVLEAQGIVAGYGEVDILHGVSIVVRRAEMVAVIGPNGAGKSTLLKAIFGLLPLRGGRVLVSQTRRYGTTA